MMRAGSMNRLVCAALLCGAGAAMAQPADISRLQSRGPIGQINRGTVPDLVDMRINNGTFPRYGTGGDIDIRSPVIKADGPRARIELHFVLDSQKLLIQPQAQVDGRLVAHLPRDFFAREQQVITTVFAGDQILMNKSGKFVPEIVPVPEAAVNQGVTVTCVAMCMTWPISRDVPPHWVSRTEIYDSVEHRASIGEEVGGKWATGQTTYLVASRKLKDQFRFTTIDIASPTISGGCPTNANENAWVYPGRPWSLPQPPYEMKQLEIYARSNVTHCRQRGRNNFDANHFMFTRLRVRIEIEGPKGVDPWQ